MVFLLILSTLGLGVAVIVVGQGVFTGAQNILDFVGLGIGFLVSLALTIASVRSIAKQSPVDELNLQREIKEAEARAEAVALKKRFLEDRLNHDGTGAIEFTYLGGSGGKLQPNQKVVLVVKAKGVELLDVENMTDSRIGVENISTIEVSGPGTVTSNAGIVGGGFGIEGFLKGAVTAALINKVTERSSTNTFLRVMTDKAEFYFHTSAIQPASLKILLSPLYVAIESRNRTSGKDIAEQLMQLQSLHAMGALSNEEYESAKRKALQ